MKKQLFATLIGLGIAMPVWSYLGPDDKKGSSEDNPKGANCSPATAKLMLEFNDVAAPNRAGG